MTTGGGSFFATSCFCAAAPAEGIARIASNGIAPLISHAVQRVYLDCIEPPQRSNGLRASCLARWSESDHIAARHRIEPGRSYTDSDGRVDSVTGHDRS